MAALWCEAEVKCCEEGKGLTNVQSWGINKSKSSQSCRGRITFYKKINITPAPLLSLYPRPRKKY